MPIPEGSSSFTLTFQTHVVTVEVFKPATYVNHPLLIAMPGFERRADNYRNYATDVGTKCACLIASPRLSEIHFPDNDYDHGKVFNNSAYDTITGAIEHPTSLNPQTEWTLQIVIRIFEHIKLVETNDNLKYYLFGHGAGAQFVNSFALFLYPLLTCENRPKRIIIGNPGSVIFPAAPIMRQSAIKINQSDCYTGPNLQLTSYPKNVNPKKTCLNCFDSQCCCEVIARINAAYVNKNYNYAKNQNIFKDRKRFKVCNDHILPFPYGLKNILPKINVKKYVHCPITFFLGDRDVNVNGGINPQCETIFGLPTDKYAKKQGPFRLFKNLNCYLAGQHVASQKNIKCKWKVVIGKGCSHNAAAMLSIPIAPFAIFGQKACKLMMNCEYQKEYVVPGARPPL